MGNDMIRMSGMNSGLDTESIINALTANTKLKATKQERNVLKYEATQEAYRDIISKMQNIKNKYFDILNKDSYLSGNTMWNKYSSKVYDSANVETLASGISVTTTVNSNPGDYKVAVNKTAKQAKLVGKTIGGNAKIDMSSLENGKTYGMTVTVGDVEKTVTFTGGANAAATRNNINDALEEAFGESNSSVGDSGNEGMVYVDGEGQMISRAGKGLTVSGVGKMNTSNTLDFSNVKSGNNVVSFQVGDKTISTSFQTMPHDYFSSAVENGIIDPDNGTVVGITDKDENGNNIRFTKATELARANLGEGATEEEIDEEAANIRAKWSEAVQLYQSITDDLKESVRYDSFKSWKESAESDGTWETKLNNLYSAAEVANKESRITKWLESEDTVTDAYTAYKNEFAINNLSQASKDAYEAYKTEQQNNGEEIDSIYEWAETDETAWKALEDAGGVKSIYEFASTATGDVKAKFDELENRYNGTTETEEELSAQYETYTNGLGEGETPKSYEDWKAEHIESNSWHLDKDMWSSSESNLYEQYKKNVYNESDAEYDLSEENVVDHFTRSSLKNSIGNLELDDGTKFEVNYDSATNKATVKAYTESDDGNGNIQKTYVNVAMTIGKNSANTAEAFGNAGSEETSSISQITNSTKLSDIGATADENGNYNFTINGKSFSFDGETTVNDMMKKINASSAGVKMTYSSLDNAFTVTSSKYGVDSEVNIEDANGGDLMSKLGIVGGDFTAGENLEVYVNGKLYQSDTNSIEVDGSTFTISNRAEEPAPGEDPVEYTVSIGKDTSAIKDLIKDFVKDYNQLIEDVYKYLDEKPEKDYYFLADADKEDLDLSEKQEEKWEEKAKKGLLYHDSITSTIMTGLRTALMGSVEGLDGNVFSLSSMGLKTMSDYNQHGKFAAIDENALDKAIDNNLDDIQKLFSDSENGIMKKFSEALDLGIGSTGKDKGTLIRKAGLATGSSAKDNEIYNAIKRTKEKVTSLNKRYENEQNRLWKRYSNMESLLGTMNSQQASFMSYFQQ